MGKQMTIYERADAAVMPILKDRQTSGRFSKLKSRPLKWEAERQFVLQLIHRDEKLAAAVAENPASLALAMIDMAILGVSLSPVRGHAYLVPQSVKGVNGVTALLSYKGLENLALTSKTVKSIQTELVYSKDAFRRGSNDTGAFVEFEMARGDRGILEGAYCRAKLDNDEVHVEWMTADELDGCHAAATAKQGKEPFAWRGKFKGEMQKKCVVRRAAKHWVLTEGFENAIKSMDAADPMSFEPDNEATALVTLLSDEHLALIRDALREAGLTDDHANHWLEMQAKAWGHAGLEFYPDDGWERLRDALLQRKDKVDKLQAERVAA